jgi:hypothetical protein
MGLWHLAGRHAPRCGNTVCQTATEFAWQLAYKNQEPFRGRSIAESLSRYILPASVASESFHNLVLGRRGAIATSSIITIAATVGAACSNTTAQLIGGLGCCFSKTRSLITYYRL